MSWLNKIENDLIITCGDGKSYRPNWVNARFVSEYNITEFNFPNVAGTLVKRNKPIGRKYELEIYFQGEDHLDNSNAFRDSADDEREWTVQHPFYGTLYVQPLSLNFDNTGLNLTKITGTIMETIAETNPRSVIAPQENVKQKVDEMAEVYEDAFTEIPTSADLNTATATNLKHFTKGVPIIEIPEEFEAYTNLFNTANAYISTAIQTPILFMRSIVSLINYPSLLTASVKIRMNQLLDQWTTLKNTVENLFKKSSKQIFQNQGAANLAAMCYTAATPLDGNYTNSVDVFFIIDKIVATYDDFLENLDSIQSENAATVLNYIPDGDVLFKLNEIVNLTISSLFEIALKAKQQRSFVLEEDSDLINLTHRLYGIDPSDNNMNELIANNQFGLDHYLVVKKNTVIYYYI